MSPSALLRRFPLLLVLFAFFALAMLPAADAHAQDPVTGTLGKQPQVGDDDSTPDEGPTVVVPPCKATKGEPGDNFKKWGKTPAKVKVAVYVLNVGQYNLAQGTYQVDFYLDMTSIDGKTPIGTQCFEFMNGRASSSTQIIDTPTEKFYRISATLMTSVDLRQFPWDVHELPLVIEDMSRSIDGDDSHRAVEYSIDADESGIDPYVNIVGWDLKGYSARVDKHAYAVPAPSGGESQTPPISSIDVSVAGNPVYGGKALVHFKDDPLPPDVNNKTLVDPSTLRPVFPNEDPKKAETYSRYTYTITIGRLYFIATIKTFLPVTCFVIVIMISMLVPIDKLDQRQNMNTAMLIASVMYHINITNSLPPVGYLTRADKVMMATYSTVAVNLFITVFMRHLGEVWAAKFAASPPADKKDDKKDDKKKDEKKKEAPPAVFPPGTTPEQIAAAYKDAPPPEKKEEKKKDDGEKKADDKKKDDKKDAKPAKPPPNPIVLKWRRRSFIIVPLYALIAYTLALLTKNG